MTCQFTFTYWPCIHIVHIVLHIYIPYICFFVSIDVYASNELIFSGNIVFLNPFIFIRNSAFYFLRGFLCPKGSNGTLRPDFQANNRTIELDCKEVQVKTILS
jgi:hypothetical protein